MKFLGNVPCLLDLLEEPCPQAEFNPVTESLSETVSVIILEATSGMVMLFFI